MMYRCLEETLVKIWSEVLKIEPIGIENNFFELGGHSLHASQVLARISERLGIEIQLLQIFEAPTISLLSNYLESVNTSTCSTGDYPLVPTPTAREADIPLSLTQQSLWFLGQLEENPAVYNLVRAFVITGPLDRTSLENAIATLIDRHEILRTTFEPREGMPFGVIAPHIRLPLSMVDLPTEGFDVIEEVILQQQNRPFDVTVGPLVRFTLISNSQEKQILLLTMHHIISDDWSIQVLLRELSSLYRAGLTQTPPSLPALPIQYVDYATWQRRRFTGEFRDSQIKYWQQQLADAPCVLNLPLDRPRTTQPFKSGRVPFLLNRDLTEKLHVLSQGKGTTLFITIFAAFFAFLSRYCHQDDIVVGTPIANRTPAITEALIGFFVNTLVLRTRPNQQHTFKEFLSQVRQVALDAYAHADIPFDLLVEQLKPARLPGVSPLFQVMFTLQNVPKETLELSGLNVSAKSLDKPTAGATFDLTLSLNQTDTELIGAFEYNANLFDQATIERMAKNFQIFVEGITGDPEQTIAKLPILSAGEQQQLLVEWNQTQTDYPRHACVHQLFEAIVQKTPDAVALRFAELALTYHQLNQKANQLAHYLLCLGVSRDVPVGICLERSFSMVIALLAILKAGGAYVPLDPGYPQKRLAYMMKTAQVSILLTQECLISQVQLMAEHTLCVDTDWPTIAQHPPTNLNGQTTPDHLAYIIYTSGSTGQPKGVAMPHQALVNLIAWQQQQTKASNTGRTLQFAPISFDVSFQEIFSTLCAGGTLVLISEDIRTDPMALLSTLNQENIARLFLPFVGLQQLAIVAEKAPSLPTHLQDIITAGEQLQISGAIRNLMERLPGCTLHNQYGPSESHVVTAFTLPEDVAQWPTLPPIGKPISNCHIHLLNEAFQPVPIGVAGELYIGGVGLARGYVNRPELTAERFIHHPDNPWARLYKTGDLARYLPDGNIEFLGRIDHQVKIRGFRIELGEIESLLSGYQQVPECVVIPREDTPGNKRLVAYVVGDDDLDISALKEYIRQQLPDYMVPSVVVPLTSLPLSPSGKIDRKALPAPDAAFSHSSDFVAPKTDSQIRIASLFAEILSLHPQSISLEDSFFELGGHSLLATQLMFRIREAFEINLSLRALFDYPSVSDLASAIDQALVTGNYQSQTWDLDAEAALDPDIQPSTAIAPIVSPMERIFLTGATGFLGTYLLSELLTTTTATVYCLVRAEHIDGGKERLLNKLEATGLWRENFTSRIIPIIGDLGTSRFGLSATEYNNLCQAIDVVYHAGAYVNHVWSYPLLKDANVLGTQEVLRLASLGKLKPVHYVSTISVLSTSQTDQPMLESATANHDDLPKVGYVQTKWVAEQLVWQAAKRGLPITIYRPSRISGHSQTGVSSFDDLLSRRVKGCIQLKSFPSWSGLAENLVPVDYVSRAIVCLSQQNRLFGKAFHLINPKSVSLREIFDWVRFLGYSLEEIDYTDWRSKLIEDIENPLYPYLPNFPESPSNITNLIEYDCRNVVDGLRGSGIKLPEVNQDLFKTYLSFFRESGFLED
ncbi:MAG: amino acid adenylation domain-containing protein [Moorea sp. SIO1G6]|uniref:non-ribosomal peptide synthetase n=1 Tax=Moorena sp. SIO1G6 TaxID=2607840 RepID=UPI0013C0F2EC|nr:non-ribosomal peptide synthetase [Moorena sp. SIO1G6]NET68682.1 amino acid adenylation domain-containing protein [Moorena sp. SIO1G6]